MSDVAEPKLACIYKSSGQLRAQVVKSKLESAGIAVLLKYDSASVVFGLTVDGLGEVEVWVPKEQANEARALIEEQTPEDEATA
jgi:hypothetical protein